MRVLFQQLREHLVFALKFLLQSLKLLLIPIRSSRAGLLAFKSGSSVLEKLSLPLIKHRRADAVLLAQIRNGFAFDQMLAQDSDLLLRAKKTSVIIVHRGLFFQASSSLASAHDFPIPSEAGHVRQSITDGGATFFCRCCAVTVSCLPRFAQPYRVVCNATIEAFFACRTDRTDVRGWSEVLGRNHALLALSCSTCFSSSRMRRINSGNCFTAIICRLACLSGAAGMPSTVPPAGTSRITPDFAPTVAWLPSFKCPAIPDWEATTQ